MRARALIVDLSEELPSKRLLAVVDPDPQGTLDQALADLEAEIELEEQIEWPPRRVTKD